MAALPRHRADAGDEGQWWIANDLPTGRLSAPLALRACASRDALEEYLVLKQRLPRFLALLGTTAVTASLIGVAVVGTGAYFTDSKPGAVTGDLGTVKVAVSGEAITFVNLLPGEDQSSTVTVTNTGTGNEDIWLVFDNTNLAWSAVNNLGAYGIFTVNGVVYDNLSNQYAAGSGPPPVISNDPESGCYLVPRPNIAYLPHAIKLGTWAPGQAASFNISFHFHACMTGPNVDGVSLWGAAASGNDTTGRFPAITPAPLNFKIAAFQQNVLPTDQMNGAGRIIPLSLPIPGDTRTPIANFQ